LTDRHSSSRPSNATEVIPEAVLREMYVTMLRIRLLEEKVADLVARGEIVCPCHLYIGQEAVATGVCASLRQDDWVFSTHRSHGHYIAKGGSMTELMAELYGKAAGCSRGRGGSMHLASPDYGLPGSSAIVAGTIPLAAGAALAFTLQHRDTVAVSFFGDGAVGEGVFYESLNFASLKKLPVIFVCENNLYSTHMPISACQADCAIYRKAEVFNIPGIRVDGNDVTEVYRAAVTAVQTTRNGGGPALIECLTYRWRGHVGPNDDIDKGLRSKDELESWMAQCPITNLEKVLIDSKLISEIDILRVREEVSREIEEAYTFAQTGSYPDADELCSGLFKT
jgi:TPP-dependent pyruvate/acetoin dehydrogenase alpha subunit